jgi:LPS-assembly lipoprotein
MSSSEHTASRRRLLLALPALALAGCGFQLRKAPEMSFRSVALRGFERRSPLADELRRSLADVATVADDPARAEVVLEALTDTRERSVVASTAAGEVRELQLRVRFRFRLLTPGGRELLPPDELVLSRDMSYNETNALAKEQEETLLYRAMQSDIVNQVMRRVSAARI